MNLESIGVTFALLFVRALGLIAPLPLGEGLSVAGQRFVFAAGLSALCCVDGANAAGFTTNGLCLEFLVGLSMGIPAALVVEAAAIFGELIDTMRGQSISTLYDPVHAVQSSVLSHLARSYQWTILLLSGALPLLVVSFVESSRRTPAGSANVSYVQTFGLQILDIVVAGLMAGFSTALPFGVVFLIVEVTVGYLGRLVPQLSLTQEGVLLKGIATALILLASYEKISSTYLPILRSALVG